MNPGNPTEPFRILAITTAHLFPSQARPHRRHLLCQSPAAAPPLGRTPRRRRPHGLHSGFPPKASAFFLPPQDRPPRTMARPGSVPSSLLLDPFERAGAVCADPADVAALAERTLGLTQRFRTSGALPPALDVPEAAQATRKAETGKLAALLDESTRRRAVVGAGTVH